MVFRDRVTVFAMLIVGIWLAWAGLEFLVYVRFGELPTPEVSTFLPVLGSLAILFLAGDRQVRRVPWVARDGYREWLATTPWSYGLPLPLGSPLPDRAVFSLVALATVLQAFFWHTLPWWSACLPTTPFMTVIRPNHPLAWLANPPELALLWPAIAFGLGYCSAAMDAVSSRPALRPGLIVPAFLLPFAVFPGPVSTLRIAVVLAVVLAVMIAFLIRGLKAFPFDEPDWNRPIHEMFLEQSILAGHLVWPLRAIGPWRAPSQKWRLGQAIGMAAIVALWVVAVSTFVMNLISPGSSEVLATPQHGLHGPAAFASMGFTCIAALRRLWVYARGGLGALSPSARLATGRWIIPAHDVVYLAPLAAVTLSTALVLVLNEAQVPGRFIVAAVVFVTLAILLGAGPSLEAWSLTGQNIKRGGLSRFFNTQRPIVQVK